MRIPPKQGVVRRNSSSASSPQKRNSFRGNSQDPLGKALGVASPPSSTTARKMIKKKKLQSLPTAPSLTSNKQQHAPPAAAEAMSVSTIGRRKLGQGGKSDYQKKQQAKKDHTIINHIRDKLKDSYLEADMNLRKKRMLEVKKQMKRRYGHLSSDVFKRYWREACEVLEAERGSDEDEEHEKEGLKRKRTLESDMSVHVPRKRSSISSVAGTAIPRRRSSTGPQGDKTIPKKRSSIRSEGDTGIPKKRSYDRSEGDGAIRKKPRKRLSQVLEEPDEVVYLVDTDDEQEGGGVDDAEHEKVSQKDKHLKNKKRRVEVPQPPIVEVDPFERAGPNRWANLIVGSKYQGERFAIGEWDSIQPFVK